MNPLSEKEQQLMAAIQDGLPLTSRPYAILAQQLRMSEQEIVTTIGSWLESGLLKRLGLIVNHHRVGYQHNVMVVWDIPDPVVDNIARSISDSSLVSLCYRRPRRLPDWPYNLFCMIHGRSRDETKAALLQLIHRCDLHDFSCELLFGTRQLKQCGGQYGKLVLPADPHAGSKLPTAAPLSIALENSR